MFLWTPATGSIGFGMTLYSMVGFTMLIANCGAQLLAVPVLDQSVLLLDGLPSKAMSPICPCYLTHSWDSGWQTPGRVPHADGPARRASGAHCCSEIPCSLVLCPQRHVSMCGHEEALQESWWWRGCVLAGGGLLTRLLFSPPLGGLAGGSS